MERGVYWIGFVPLTLLKLSVRYTDVSTLDFSSFLIVDGGVVVEQSAILILSGGVLVFIVVVFKAQVVSHDSFCTLGTLLQVLYLHIGQDIQM